MWCLQCRGPGTVVPSPPGLSCGRDATSERCPGAPAAGAHGFALNSRLAKGVKLLWCNVLIMPRPRADSFRPRCPSGPCLARCESGEASDVVLWSPTASGARRYRCGWCRSTFSPVGGSKEERVLLRTLNALTEADSGSPEVEAALFRAARLRHLGLRKGSASDVSLVVRSVLAQEPLSQVARLVGVDRSTALNWLRRIALDPAGREALDFWISEAIEEPRPAWVERTVEAMRKLGASY